MNLRGPYFRRGVFKDRFCRATQPLAFSLLEILVAVALLALIVVGLLSMFYQTQRAFRAGVNQSDVMEAGRTAMDFLARELQELAASGESNVVNTAAFIQPFSFMNPSVQPVPNAQDRTNRLYDFTYLRRANDNWIASAYRVNSSNGVGTLYRWVQATNLNGVSNLSYYAVNLTYTKPPLAAPYSDPRFQRVIDGVIHFQLHAFDTNGFLIDYNTADGSVFTDVVRGNFVFGWDALPAYIDIELGILENVALKRFEARGAIQGPTYLQGQAGKVHLFRQRVPIRSAP